MTLADAGEASAHIRHRHPEATGHSRAWPDMLRAALHMPSAGEAAFVWLVKHQYEPIGPLSCGYQPRWRSSGVGEASAI